MSTGAIVAAGSATSSVKPIKLDIPVSDTFAGWKSRLPPTGTFQIVGDTSTGRLRCYVGPEDDRASKVYPLSMATLSTQRGSF